MYTIHNAILWAPFLFDGMVFSKFVESVLKNLSQHVDTDTDFWISQFSAKKYVAKNEEKPSSTCQKPIYHCQDLVIWVLNPMIHH